MNELMLSAINELNNKQFKKDVQGIANALASKDKSNFKIASHVNSILSKESWKDDFESEKDMAEFLGMSKSQLSMLKKTDDIKKTITPSIEILDRLTLTKLYEFAPIYNKINHSEISKEEKEEAFANIVIDFMTSNSFLSENPENLIEMSQKELRETIKTWLQLNDDSEIDETQETETQETQETETQDKPIPEIVITFRDGNTFEIDDNIDFLVDLTRVLKKYKYI